VRSTTVIDSPILTRCGGFQQLVGDSLIGIAHDGRDTVDEAAFDEIPDGHHGSPGGGVKRPTDAAKIVDRAIDATGGVVDVERELEVDTSVCQ
jgi:hypothetical protein